MKKQAGFAALGTLCLFFALQQRAWAQSEDVPRYEVGGQFSTLTTNNPSGNTRPGFGGRFTVNITDYLAAEAQGDFYPSNNNVAGTFNGGRAASAVFGIKAGKRFERFGIYGKVRPGLIHFSRTLSGFHLDPNILPAPVFVADFRGRTEFATDVGAVLEFYPTRRIVTRFDIGDMIIRYRERVTNIPVLSGDATPTVSLVPFTEPSVTKHNFQFSAGIGFRF
jgi:Outer membrane protein beta-barrel domain